MSTTEAESKSDEDDDDYEDAEEDEDEDDMDCYYGGEDLDAEEEPKKGEGDEGDEYVAAVLLLFSLMQVTLTVL